MSRKHLSIIVLMILAGIQFLVVPTFSSMSHGGKIAAFSLFVSILALCVLLKKSDFFFPRLLVPLCCLAFVFFISLFRSQWPALGITELYVYTVCLVFCLLVVTLANTNDTLKGSVFVWFRVVGVIIAVLCLYQYIDWILFGQRDGMLLSYLLPPGSSRVNGVYGQSNLTALFLLVSVIAFLRSYASENNFRYKLKTVCFDLGFLSVSVAFFLTHSRAGLLAFCVVISVFFFLISRGKIFVSRDSLVKVSLVLVAGFAISQIPFTAEISTATRSEISVDARFVFWASSVLMFLNSPLLGVGLDHFKLLLPSYARQAHDFLGFVQYEAMGYTVWSHNELLQVLAESGIVGFLFLIIFFILLANIVYVEVLKAKPDIEKLFLFLMLLPFFVQGMFSWPFRHPALLFVFFFLLGVTIADTTYIKIQFTTLMKVFGVGILALSVLMVVKFSLTEYRYVQLKSFIQANGCKNSDIFSLIEKPYLEFKILREVLPLCLADDTFYEDRAFVESLKPYFLKITDMQGTHSQWFNMGVIYRNLEEYPQAKAAFQTAVERQPVSERGWTALHMVNVEEIARKTGRPIQDFLPPEINSSVDYNMLFQDITDK